MKWNQVFFPLAFAGISLAALPPGWSEQKQANAPEALNVRIISLQVDSTGPLDNCGKHDIRAKALVLEVRRTATELESGDTIEIAYSLTASTCTIPESGVVMSSPSPGQPSALVNGQEFPAFLRKSDSSDVYEPDAASLSFVPEVTTHLDRRRSVYEAPESGDKRAIRSANGRKEGSSMRAASSMGLPVTPGYRHRN